MTVEIGVDLATNGGFENDTARPSKIPGWDLEVIHGNVIVGNGYTFKGGEGGPGFSWVWGGQNITSLESFIESETSIHNWTDVEIWSGHDSECALIAHGSDFFFVLTQRIPTEGNIRVDEPILADISLWMSCKDFTGVQIVKMEAFGGGSQMTSPRHFANFTSDGFYKDFGGGVGLDPGVEYIAVTIAMTGSGTIAIDDFSLTPEWW